MRRGGEIPAGRLALWGGRRESGKPLASSRRQILRMIGGSHRVRDNEPREGSSMSVPGPHPATMDLEDRLPIRRLMGLAVFGEMLAARIYGLMAQLRPEYSPVLRKFASMEGQHASWFREACRGNAIEPDKEFA